MQPRKAIVILSKGRAVSQVRTRIRRKWRGALLSAALGALGTGALVAVTAPSAAAATAGPPPVGYWMMGANGALWSFGGALDVSQTINDTAQAIGSPLGIALSAPIVAMAATPDGNGYWAVGADGGIFTYGDAHFYGSVPGLGVKLSQPIVGIAATPDGKGYWLVGRDGGIFAFGDAPYEGSLPGMGISVDDVVGISRTKDGQGYWLVGSDGGVFAFGDAPFLGSIYTKTGAGSTAPIVAIAGAPNDSGYLVLRDDGAVFAFGTPFFGGSPLLSGITTNAVAISYTSDGDGYWVVGSDGGVFTYGDAPYLGSIPGDLADTGVTNSTPMVTFAPVP